MKLYEKDNIDVSLIKEIDRKDVVDLFVNNNFNCDYEIGILKPSKKEFNEIIDKIIYEKDNENNILVIHKNNKVVGYVSLFIDYDRLHIGHIAIKENEQNKGYGKILINVIKEIAENEERNIVTECFYNKNNVFYKNGFDTADRIHYYYNLRGKKNDSIPKLFVSKNEEKIRRLKEEKKATELYQKFLKSKIGKMVLKI